MPLHRIRCHFSKIDYNEYIKLIVPFDNDTIYYENNVWKAKQSAVSSITVNPPLNKKDDGSIELLIDTDKFDIDENSQFSLNESFIVTLNRLVRIYNAILDKLYELDKKTKWEIVNTSDFNVGDTQYILPVTPDGIYIYYVKLGYKNTNTSILVGEVYFREKDFNNDYNIYILEIFFDLMGRMI